MATSPQSLAASLTLLLIGGLMNASAEVVAPADPSALWVSRRGTCPNTCNNVGMRPVRGPGPTFACGVSYTCGTDRFCNPKNTVVGIAAGSTTAEGTCQAVNPSATSPIILKATQDYYCACAPSKKGSTWAANNSPCPKGYSHALSPYSYICRATIPATQTSPEKTLFGWGTVKSPATPTSPYTDSYCMLTDGTQVYDATADKGLQRLCVSDRFRIAVEGAKPVPQP